MKSVVIQYQDKSLDLYKLKPEDIQIKDIATALSKICRYAGRISEFYSVAQHSVIVSKKASPKLAFAALLHDAAEAYIGDVISPIKNDLPRFQQLEKRVFNVILERFGLIEDYWIHEQHIKMIDKFVIQEEMAYFYGDAIDILGHRPIEHRDAFWEFLRVFYRLEGKKWTSI